MPTDLTDRPSILRNPAMRVRRHRSFRPRLDVLPDRIAPSSVVATPAAAVTLMDSASSEPPYYSYFDNPAPWTITEPSMPVDP